MSELECACEEIQRLRARIAGRILAPTEAEVRAHAAAGGVWLITTWREGDEHTRVRVHPKQVMDDVVLLTQTDEPARWVPLRYGCPCEWPEVPRG